MNAGRWFRSWQLRGIAVAAAVLFVSAPGASGASEKATAASGGTLVFAAVAPFTGPDADFGPEDATGCYAGAYMVTQGGGILGHRAQCITVDTRGDPADAVPAIRKLLATTPNLVGVIGPTSDETTATAPIFNQAKIPFFTESGQSIFLHNTYQYLYRMTPADAIAGYAMAIWAHRKGFTRGAAVFGNDIGSQGTVPTLMRGFSKLHGKLVIDEKVALDQSSYRTEVEKVIAAHPQVIFTEVDAQTAATFFSELKQLHGMYPVIGADPTLDPTWFKAISGAIGARTLLKYFTAETPASVTGGTAWHVYLKGLLSGAKSIRNYKTYTGNGYTETDYDSVNVMALSMIEAKSTTPAVYQKYMMPLVRPKRGAVQVATFKQGMAALRAGKKIQYVGVTGGISFDKWHNSPGHLEIEHFMTNGNIVRVPGTKLITPSDINALSH